MWVDLPCSKRQKKYSSTMRENFAIQLNDVSKVYKLHGSHRDQLVDVLHLQRLGFRIRNPVREHVALSHITLNVPRGHRIGIVGRNGAGKTTLLKLLCGNFSPTSGSVEISGAVQALMNVGLGFHPEYTGKENVAASLQYNGLAKDEYAAAMRDIADFCELGEYFEQPFKTYSLGMQARLMFAAATAIRPDVLIVDEVLGAGDAYFVAKSKARVEKLVSAGCTMLLVSHSMQQVLELCDEVVWLDNGRIQMQGDAFLVVKAYEEYLHGPIQKIVTPYRDLAQTGVVAEDDVLQIISMPAAEKRWESKDFAPLNLQEPRFLPHEVAPVFPVVHADGFDFEAPGGVSRWDSEPGVKIFDFSIVTETGKGNSIVAMRPAKFAFGLVAEQEAHFNCSYGVAIHDHLGVCVTSIFSPADSFDVKAGEIRRIEMVLNPCQLGPGSYTIGISVTEHSTAQALNQAKRYDLLSRSFSFQVVLPDSLAALSSRFFHTAEWAFNSQGLSNG